MQVMTGWAQPTQTLASKFVSTMTGVILLLTSITARDFHAADTGISIVIC